MSMLNSFFAKGFNAAKCKTLLKLTVPRIKLLRNRREIQLKQMRREIAKLLETGQEATARIRVEHIIREEKMMAAQEIVELFSELIAVRLPIIETQRECPLDLKEAISSLCFAAPRCADLPELQQVQMLFAAKFGKEFVAAATELMPECGVNRQLVELLSVRAPDPEVKMKLLKDIAEEHELDWDPTASENELLKSHEDLLNGPSQFVSGSRLPLPEEKHNESAYAPSKQLDSDDDFEKIDFPEVPKASVRPTVGTVSAPEMLPFPEVEFESTIDDDSNEETLAHGPEPLPEISTVSKQSEPELVPHEVKNIPSEKPSDSANLFPGLNEASKQSVPFVSPLSSMVRESEPLCQPVPRTKSEVNVDLQDVLAAAQAAADSAERAAAAARSAASLAQVRISELVKKNNDEMPDGSSENPFYSDTSEAKAIDKPQISRADSSGENIFNDHKMEFNSSFPSYYDNKVGSDSFQLRNESTKFDVEYHQPQRLPSMDDELYSYPNLFKRQDSNIEPSTHPYGESSRPSN